MKFAVTLALFTTLILLKSYGAQAQTFRSLMLVKGDTSNSCSFISTNELSSVDIAQRLLGIVPGYSPLEVETQMGFPSDQPYAGGMLRWTNALEGNYVRAMVIFRNNGATTRLLTMGNNYQQSNQKQCSWVVKDSQTTNSQFLQAP